MKASRTSSPQAHKPFLDNQVAPRKQRSSEARSHAPARPSRQLQQQPFIFEETPAAGAHAARHLVNEEATPGAGVLPSFLQRFGKEVDGAAG